MSLIAELKRRNVIRVTVAYIVLAWVVLQVGDVLFEALNLSPSANTLLLAILALGLIPTVVFAWAFELTPDGIKKEADVDRARSVTAQTARKLDIAVIVLILVGIAVVAFDRFVPKEQAVEPVATDQRDVESMPAESGDSAMAGGLIEPDSLQTGSNLTGDRSIAVLPFTNMSADPENKFFADGVSEEILNRLAQVPGLRVIARTSSFSFKDKNIDLREVGETLDSTYVLEGSVRRQGDDARITAQLIDARDGAHLWSEAYDIRLTNVFEAQDQIAIAVTEAMNIILDERSRQAMRSAGIRSVEAFVAFQKGRAAHSAAHDRGGDIVVDLEEANRHFDEALKFAPNLAAAYLQKADRYAHIVLEKGHTDAERSEALITMGELLEKAHDVANDPARKAWARVDSILFSDDWSLLRSAVESALSMDQCEVGNWLELVTPFGYEDEILTHLQRLTRCDPLFPFPYTFVASTYANRGDFEQAREVLEKATLAVGEHRWLIQARVKVAQMAGDWAQAETLLRSWSTSPASELARRADLLALQGRIDEAAQIFAQAQEKGEQSLRARIFVAVALGDRREANRVAAELDDRPGGFAELIRIIESCDCGAPFDLEVTPNLAQRLRQANFSYPPPVRLVYPAKDW